jgi:hypothetical protein
MSTNSSNQNYDFAGGIPRFSIKNKDPFPLSGRMGSSTDISAPIFPFDQKVSQLALCSLE